MNACTTLPSHVTDGQQLGKTVIQPGPCVFLAEKLMAVAAAARHDGGSAYQRRDGFEIAERLLAECQIPICGRTEVGSTGSRRACCMGLSVTSREALKSRQSWQPFISQRSLELQAATKHLCAMVRERYPSLYFTPLQININPKARLHSGAGNVGLSAVVAFGSFGGGQAFTISDEGTPVVHTVT